MKKKMTNREKTYVAVIIPVLVLFFLFNTLPMLKGVMYSFTNYKGYGSYESVGLRNYIDLFTDARVGKSYLFTFKYAIVGTVLVNVLSLIMALALNSKIRFKSALRGIYFVPNILGGLVIGYIFSFIFTYILPTVGNVFGISWLQNSILASEKYAWIGVLIVGVWQAVAMNTIIYISGLQTVPEEVYEASMLDGTGKWREFWKITLPLVIMSGTGQNTLPLAQLNFQSQFGTNYNLAFASYILALIPILIFYVICQKQILNGVANGAVKG